MFSLLVCLDCIGESNRDVGGPFCNFSYFLSLIDLMIQFIRLIDMGLSLYALLTTSFFFPADFFQPWQAQHIPCLHPSDG
jgi:hypothetical protein